jgi:hypothetical protein
MGLPHRPWVVAGNNARLRLPIMDPPPTPPVRTGQVPTCREGSYGLQVQAFTEIYYLSYLEKKLYSQVKPTTTETPFPFIPEGTGMVPKQNNL